MGVTRVLKEMIERYCERAGEEDRCGKYLHRILDSINCIKIANTTAEADDQVDLTLDIADADLDTGRRLLEDSDGTTDILLDAVKDDPTYVASAESTSNSIDNSQSP